MGCKAAPSKKVKKAFLYNILLTFVQLLQALLSLGSVVFSIFCSPIMCHIYL